MLARWVFDLKNTNDLIRKGIQGKGIIMHNSYLKYSDMDELISDNGIPYNKKRVSPQIR